MTDELEGPLEPPMVNGELLFESPWQGRVFGMARVLAQAGLYTWDEFRAELIRAIGDWDRTADDETGSEYRYYDHFLVALERVLADRKLLDGDLLRTRIDAYRARPHGHDH